MGRGVLTINSGSSSVKFSVYSQGERLALSGRLERVGLPKGSFSAHDGSGAELARRALPLPDHDAAFTELFDWLGSRPEGASLAAIGHRVVHGKAAASAALIDERLMVLLASLVPFAAEHLPHEIKAIEAASLRLPGLAQVACFDTSFHAHMPRAARAFALPAALLADGVQRYGFHGLSYEFVMEELGKVDPQRARNRTIIAHLGNGASMCAVKEGRSVDTTMGFTPLGGLVMSTRPGDLDPGVIVYLLKKHGYGPDELNRLLNRSSGLLGISGLSPDMADLLKSEGSSPGAALAVEVFCLQAKKHLAAMAASLGGVDTLVFTAGIGEGSPVVRERVADGLGFMGIELDPGENRRGSPLISRGPVAVRVMRTNEELMIARHTARALGLWQ